MENRYEQKFHLSDETSEIQEGQGMKESGQNDTADSSEITNKMIYKDYNEMFFEESWGW
jgi:hypothetical protein